MQVAGDNGQLYLGKSCGRRESLEAFDVGPVLVREVGMDGRVLGRDGRGMAVVLRLLPEFLLESQFSAMESASMSSRAFLRCQEFP